MGDENTWRQVINIIRRYDRPFVIVSATARTTRRLVAAAERARSDLDASLNIAEEIRDRHLGLVYNFIDNFPEAKPAIRGRCNAWIADREKELKSYLRDIHKAQELTEKQTDAVAAIGEQLSSYLFSACCTVAGLDTIWINAAEIIQTDSDFGHATPDMESINNKAAKLLTRQTPGQIPIMGGYYGQDADGNITTLGFEGSDYTASLVGAAVNAEAIEIWTDVNGIYTCDPRFVEQAKPIRQLNFQEATELAYFGAKVLHPSTTKPASSKGITIWVKNIFDPDTHGTCISRETHKDSRVKAMAFKDNCVVLTITSANTVMGYAFLAGVFEILRDHHLAVDVVTTTEASVSIALENSEPVGAAIRALRRYGSVERLNSQGIISLVGCRQKGAQQLINEVLSNIEDTSANLISFSRTKGNLNLVLDEKRLLPSVKKIHRHLFE